MAVDLSVVVPVYRNEATLRELHARLTSAARHCTHYYELIFVEDGSPDGSRALLRELAESDPRVVCLALSANSGQNRAVLAGIAYATGAAIVVLDADLQDPPEAIPQLLAALRPPIGAVFAGRRGRYESLPRLATSWLFKRTLHLLSGRSLPPDAGLFVALRRELAERLLAMPVDDPYVLQLMAACRMPMVALPVERAPSPEGSSSYTHRTRLRLALRALRGMLVTWRQVSIAAPDARTAALALVGETYGSPRS